VGIEMLQENKKAEIRNWYLVRWRVIFPIIHIKFTLFKGDSGGLSLMSLTSTKFMSR
jgi:hypothetical protein